LASTADHFVFAEDLGKKQYHVPGNELLDPGPGPVSGGGVAPLDTAGDPGIHTDAAIDLLTLFGKHAAGYAADHFTI
jgi:hypothetical protein